MKEFKNEKGNLIDISTVDKSEIEKYLGEWYKILGMTIVLRKT
jgi:lipocalin